MSSKVLAVLEGKNVFGNFATFHTYKFLRTAAEIENGRQSEFVALEDKQQVCLQNYFLDMSIQQ